ncbi:MAG: hypothetical protein RLN85_14065 [Pseudomonadales bacterium]|jgi:hypothetical protein|tara:strand:- start:13399 stop:13638 length:240 start_codon:yes stop_codon:yes gene_type:complete
MSPLLISTCSDKSELAWAIEIALGVATINEDRDYPSDRCELQIKLRDVRTVGEFNAIAMRLNTSWSELEARRKRQLVLS